MVMHLPWIAGLGVVMHLPWGAGLGVVMHLPWIAGSMPLRKAA